MSESIKPIPSNGVLLHIGPYKTGTTALQSSLSALSDSLSDHGVHYPTTKFAPGEGAGTRHARASWALLGRAPRGVADVEMAEWDALVDDVRSHPDQRVVVSSEDFSSLHRETAAQAAEQLGIDRIHVVMIARRLSSLMPSAWQQRVKSAVETRTYPEFIDEVMAEERTGAAAKTFWHNHSMQRQLEMWRSILPADQITVIVTDESDRGQQLRIFEKMLDLPEGLLVPGPSPNTSLSYPRAEFLRRINVAAVEASWASEDRRAIVFNGLIPALRAAGTGASDTKIPALPQETQARLDALDRDRVTAVASSDVQVIGDPEWLALPVDHSDEIGLPQTVDINAAVASLMAAHEVTERRTRRRATAATRAKLAAASAKHPQAPAGPQNLWSRARHLAGRTKRRIASKLR